MAILTIANLKSSILTKIKNKVGKINKTQHGEVETDIVDTLDSLKADKLTFTFALLTDLASYLSNAERKAGQIVTCQETPGLTYTLSTDTLSWITNGVQLGETSSTSYRGDRGKTAYDHSQVAHDKTLVGLSNVDNTSDANKPVSNAQALALSTVSGSNIDQKLFNVAIHPEITTAMVYYLNNDAVTNGDGSVGSPFNSFENFTIAVKNYRITGIGSISLNCSGTGRTYITAIAQKNLSTLLLDPMIGNVTFNRIMIFGTPIQYGVASISASSVDSTYDNKYVVTGSGFTNTDAYYRGKHILYSSSYYPIGYSGNDGNDYVFVNGWALSSVSNIWEFSPLEFETLSPSQLAVTFGDNSGKITFQRFKVNNSTAFPLTICAGAMISPQFFECEFTLASPTSNELSIRSTYSLFTRCSFANGLNSNASPGKNTAGNINITDCVLKYINMQSCKDLFGQRNIFSITTAISSNLPPIRIYGTSVFTLSTTIIYQNGVTIPSAISSGNNSSNGTLNSVIQSMRIFTPGSGKITNLIGINPIGNNDIGINVPYNIFFKSQIIGLSNVTNISIPSFTFTGTTDSSNNILTLTTPQGLYVGQSISAVSGISSNTVITAISTNGLIITLSNQSTLTGSRTVTATIDTRYISSQRMGSYLFINGQDYCSGRNEVLLLPTVQQIALTCGAFQSFVGCEATGKIYKYVASGSVYTVNNDSVLATLDGGNTRYVQTTPFVRNVNFDNSVGIQLDLTVGTYYNNFTITAPIAITKASDDVIGGLADLTMISDATNIPTISWATMATNSALYNNTLNAKNHYTFYETANGIYYFIENL